MASSKEMSSSRPTSSVGFPHKSATSRQHAHSISLGAMNPSHRISRRKSVNSAAASSAAHAVAAVLREQGELSANTSSHRRSLGSRKSLESTSMGNPSGVGVYFSRSIVGTGNPDVADRKESVGSDDEADEEEITAEKSSNMKGRNRRASEGAYLAKGEGKRLPAELRCDTCGKGYKHSSCLTKHMWEHDPAWAYTSKLLISKHQQVQLLEAASVLVTMNVDGSTPPEASHMPDSEGSSASPAFSGSSEVQDELSSTETTPPPMSDAAVSVPSHKRYSSSSAGFSRSYRSIPSSSYAESMVSPGLPPQRYSSADYRPTTSGTDDGGLAAAAELLNFGTPRTRATQMPPDIPPVPPLPQQYQFANRLSGNNFTPTVFNPLGMHPLTQPISDERDVKMQEQDLTPQGNYHRKYIGGGNRDAYDDGRKDEEDEDGMFSMEE